MNTLANRKLMQYLLIRKSTSTMAVLSIFMLPFALLYTRGVFGWLISIFWVLISIIPIDIISVWLGARTALDFECLVGYSIMGICYFLFTITDASRVNEKILHELRYDACIDNITNNGKDNENTKDYT